MKFKQIVINNLAHGTMEVRMEPPGKSFYNLFYNGDK